MKIFSVRASTILSLFFLLLIIASCNSSREKKLLIFSKTAGFRHGSIETGVKNVKAIAQREGYTVITTEDPSYFTEDTLKTLSAVVFLNTTGNVLDAYQQADFERYIQSGGGYVGIHAATDTEYDWPWYGELAGAYFKGHPHIQDAELMVKDTLNPIVSHLPNPFVFDDEWYNFRNISDKITPLLELDESSYKGGTNGEYHPAAWIQEFDGGKSFYTVLGHQNKTFENQNVLTHILEGIKYAVGDNKRDYSKAKSERVPTENRFVRSILLQNLYEPMEIDVLDDNNLIFIERNGGIFTFNTKTNNQTKVMDFPVYSGLEDGLLGMAVDPNYESNNWIYLYYSPKGDKPIQHLSRFVFKDGELDMESEKVVLVVDVQRDECCHSGGSLEFGPDGLIYLSTGDNTNPFASDGYAPIDERQGRSPWDAQKSSANANDLRGKVLRIKPTPDGGYEIPEGNLFPPGTEGTRSEIYIMGCRNPFRISIDQKRNWLYWGDVGPDAGAGNDKRGPKGIDELNQAREAGFYGWPYSRGNNIPYKDYNFATKVSGEKFDVNNPVNDSPNNTGIKNLPPIQKSLVWYSYDKSREFSWVGTGGKNPMGGPTYYSEEYRGSGKRFPSYFDGKVFFYDWMRDWIFLITLDENGDYYKAERFMPNSAFNNPIDMVFANDGTLYILEYGEKWKARNMDARLNRIEFVKGNRAPVARIDVDKTVGALPLTINFSGESSQDFDGDNLTYTWNFTGQENQASGKKVSYTFNESGTFDVKLTVKDDAGKKSSITRKIYAGNEPPTVNIKLNTENTFYWENKKVDYEVVVEDNEDGSLSGGEIDASKVKVSLNYLKEGQDLAEVVLGHQQSSKPKGLELIEGSDCIACHHISKKVNGPSYTQIAEKYSEKDIDYLAERVVKGGNGTWGENMMSAHPQLDLDDVKTMVSYILSTAEKNISEENMIDIKGTITFDKHLKEGGVGNYVLLATYTDNGGEKVEALSAEHSITFAPPITQAEDATERSEQMNKWNAGGSINLSMIQHNTFFRIDKIDGKNLKDIMMRNFFAANYNYGGNVEVRLDKIDGKLIGRQKIAHQDSKAGHEETVIDIDSFEGVHNIYFVFKNSQEPKRYIANTDWVYFRYSE